MDAFGPSKKAPKPMDQMRLEQIFADQVEAITGPTGVIQTKVDGIPVYCISDAPNDRMRIIAPIRQTADLDPRVFELLLRANFHSTGDARYAVSEGVIFSTFMHPISSLTPELIQSGLSQVVNLAKTFGTTFSSSELIFPPLPGQPAGEATGEKPEDADAL